MSLLIFLYFVGFFVLVAGTVALSVSNVLLKYAPFIQDYSIVITIIILLAIMTMLSYVTFDILRKMFVKWGIEICTPTKKTLTTSVLIVGGIMALAFELMHIILGRLTDNSVASIIAISLFSIIFGFATKRYVDSVYAVKHRPISK